jgi:Ser/Thr protein kinase RdoA (MazF antagonist)
MEYTPTLFGDIARRALAAYDMQGCSLAFIRHSDNATFRVEKPGSDAFLLRIHIPITIAMGTHGADPQAITSELLWLEALSQDTDLVLQKPVRNQAGELVTRILVEEAGGLVNCTLLSWLDGQPYHRDLESEHTAGQIGTILAKLHLHASQWKVPEGFTRPRRDLAYFERMLNGLRPALADGRISPSDYAEFETSIGVLGEMMRSLDGDRRNDGIMHADAHKGNLLYHEGQIRLIDFSFCAWGNFMFDVSICLSDMKQELHTAFLKSYRDLRSLPDGYQKLVEGFFVGGMVGTFSYWESNPRVQGWLATKVPQIARDYAAKFNRGEHFWFSWVGG